MKYYENDIYPTGLVISNDIESVNKYYTDIDGNAIQKRDSLATAYVLKRKTSGCTAAGIIFNAPITPKLSAHEGFHAAVYMMDHIGMKLSYDNDEAWAYLIGWIAECIYDFNKNNLKKKK